MVEKKKIPLGDDMIFRAYQTKNPHAALEKYLETTGKEPTAIIIRPGFHTETTHPLMIESVYGAYGAILVTHRITIDKLQKMAADRRSASEIVDELIPDEEIMDLDEIQNIHKPENGKPKSVTTRVPKPVCPHCKQDIAVDHLNDLGWWYGWKENKEPPYWDALRLYVFRRDGYTCKKCGEILSANKLVAHHIVPKESGGEDSARNLLTLCHRCHPDDKPMFEDLS